MARAIEESKPLDSLRIRGLTSIVDTTIDLSSDVTLLVGANGAGKSNIVDAFELLGRVADGQLNEHVLRRGGMQRLLFAGTATVPPAKEVHLTARWGDDWPSGYAAQIGPGSEGSALVREKLLLGGGHEGEFVRDFDVRLESVLKRRAGVLDPDDARDEVSDEYVASHVAAETLSGCRVFHFDDTRFDAPPKQRVDVADDITLGREGHNLAPLLLRMQRADRPRYDQVVRTIQSVAPFFDDFVFDTEYGTMLLRWRERGIDRVFQLDAMSDGTLRFVCLATLLMQPSPPAVIVLDEPELGLHPFAIHQLEELLRAAARRSRIVLATQSVTLLSRFSIDEVVIVDRTARGSVASRPDRERLRAWLEDYSLGELWEMNLLGGRPSMDRSAS